MALVSKDPGERFTDEERAAMRQTIAERNHQRSGKPEQQEAQFRAALATLTGPDRVIGLALHALVSRCAPQLVPKTWYGMPAYFLNGSVLLFFQPRTKFKTRYATVGFSDAAKLDQGSIWPVAFAVGEWTPEVEMELEALVARAIASKATTPGDWA